MPVSSSTDNVESSFVQFSANKPPKGSWLQHAVLSSVRREASHRSQSLCFSCLVRPGLEGN